MIQIKFGDEYLPQKFSSKRSANIFVNKMLREVIKNTVPAGRTITKEYRAGIANKFSLVESPVRLRKRTQQFP